MNSFKNINKIIGNIFEKEYVLFTRNATTAIWLILKSLDIYNKKIVVPNNICFSVICSIYLSNNEPYFIDIDKNYSIDPKILIRVNDNNIAAVILPHMYGNIANIKKIIAITKSNNWILIEDTAQALGSKLNHNYAGSFCDYSIASFGMGKIVDINIGGAVCLNSKIQYTTIQQEYNKLPVLSKNILSEYQNLNMIYILLMDIIETGDNLCKMGKQLVLSYKNANINKLPFNNDFISELEYKLSSLTKICDIRNNNAYLFQSIIKNDNITLLKHAAGSTYWRQNIIVNKNRNELLDYLKYNDVKASKYFPSIDKLFLKRTNHTFEQSDYMTKTIINLWPGNETNVKDIIRINELINKYYDRKVVN